MLQYIKACFEEPTLQSTELQRKSTAVYSARFIQAIVYLMPYLRKCYIPEDNTDIIEETAINSWNNISGILKENCQYCWGKWLDIVMQKVIDLIKCLPQEFTLEANVDYLMMVIIFFNNC